MIPPKRFDISPPLSWGMLRKGLDAFIFFFKAVVSRKYPRIPAFHQFRYTVTHLKTKTIYAVQRQYQLVASIRPLKPQHAACADRLEREVYQLDRAAPLKVRACRGT